MEIKPVLKSAARSLLILPCFFIALGTVSAYSFAQSDAGLTTPVTIENSGDPNVNPITGAPTVGASLDRNPSQIALGPASQHYVQQEQRKAEDRTTGMGALGWGLIVVLAIGGVAYFIHPNRRQRIF